MFAESGSLLVELLVCRIGIACMRSRSRVFEELELLVCGVTCLQSRSCSLALVLELAMSRLESWLL